MKSNDEPIDVVIDKTRLAHYRGTDMYDLLERAGTIRLRIVNFKLGGDTYGCVATNLDESEFHQNDIAHIYSLRWGIETAFDILIC